MERAYDVPQLFQPLHLIDDHNRSVVSDVSGKVQGIVYHMPDAKASRHARGIVRSGDWVMRETARV
ncbi:MAG: hypothetical protein OWT27_10135 [Firmicutes bacterium]|nr:hypothetical protein [Bacillota bacterium]